MFTFQDYRLIPTTEEMREHLAAWIESDPEHRGKVHGDFFIKNDIAGENNFALLDKNGEVVFYFKMERALRIHIQFGPASTPEERERNREGMIHGFAWLRDLAHKSGFRHLFFESSTALLIRFCTKRLGFKKSPHELLCTLPPLKAQEAQEKA